MDSGMIFFGFVLVGCGLFLYAVRRLKQEIRAWGAEVHETSQSLDTMLDTAELAIMLAIKQLEEPIDAEKKQE